MESPTIRILVLVMTATAAMSGHLPPRLPADPGMMTHSVLYEKARGPKGLGYLDSVHNPSLGFDDFYLSGGVSRRHWHNRHRPSQQERSDGSQQHGRDQGQRNRDDSQVQETVLRLVPVTAAQRPTAHYHVVPVVGVAPSQPHHHFAAHTHFAPVQPQPQVHQHIVLQPVHPVQTHQHLVLAGTVSQNQQQQPAPNPVQDQVQEPVRQNNFHAYGGYWR